MSIEPDPRRESPREAWRAKERAKRERGIFSRRLVGTIVVLAVVAGGFAFASVVQGPRLNGGDVDALRATVLAGEQATLEVNQPVASLDADAVSVEPAVDATAEADDRTITITFEEPLDYATDYTVRVPSVVGAFQGVPATLEYRFSTPDEQAYALLRRSDGGEADVIQRAALGGGEPEVVFTGSRIQEFASVDDILAVVTIDDADRNDLVLSQGGQAQPADAGLPDDASVRDLAASRTHPFIGFVLDTPAVDGVKQFDNALMTMELSGATPADPTPVLGLDGTPIRVLSWVFVPGSAAVVVQDFEQSLFLVQLLGNEPPTPLGVHTEIRGFVPGTSRLVIADPDRGAVIDLTEGTTTTLELQSADLADNVHARMITMLDDESRYLVTLMSATAEGDRTVLSSLLGEVDAAGQMREVFAPATGTSLIREYCVSPNGQYAAVAASAESGRPDGYSNNPGYTETMTSVVEISTGRTVLTLSGGFSDWCSV